MQNSKQGTRGRDSFKVLVFLYHIVSDKVKGRNSICPGNFFKQLNFLLSNNFCILDLRKAVSLLVNNENPPPRSVIFTFDDGYEQVYKYVYPVFLKEKLPFTVFLSTKYVGMNNSWNCRAEYNARHLNRRQVVEMLNNGVDIEDHGSCHDNFLKLSKTELEKNLLVSRAWFKENLHMAPASLAYPYGQCDTRVKGLAKKYYNAAFATKDGVFDWAKDRYFIRRFDVGTDEFSLIKFKGLLSRYAQGLEL